MSAFGWAHALCSLVFGPLIKVSSMRSVNNHQMQLFGCTPLFCSGGVVNMLMLLTMLLWPPNAADTALFYALAACWGTADGVWNTQVSGFWVTLCAEQSLPTAFSNYRLWEAVGMALQFVLVPVTSTRVKLMLLLGALTVSMVTYAISELCTVE